MQLLGTPNKEKTFLGHDSKSSGAGTVQSVFPMYSWQAGSPPGVLSSAVASLTLAIRKC